jgi:hypothetical protein
MDAIRAADAHRSIHVTEGDVAHSFEGDDAGVILAFIDDVPLLYHGKDYKTRGLRAREKRLDYPLLWKKSWSPPA